MKTIPYRLFIPFALVLLGIIRILSIQDSENDMPNGENNEQQDSVLITNNRESITFILGEDNEEDNPFYAEATNYYLNNEEAKTDRFVTDCRSILEVQDYLDKNKPENNMPWGLINLVTHGNQWLGLSVKVTPNSNRASADRIIEYIENDSLRHLSETIIDNNTEIFIHACGLGNNEKMLLAISEAFSGGRYKPKVKASKLFEFYTSFTNNGSITESERYYAEAKFIVYKMGSKPENKVIANMLNQKYPNSDIDFSDAISREAPRYTGDTYHYTFEVPVKWVIPYPDSASYPDLSTKERQQQWIGEQEEITDILKQLDIPQDQFNWWFREVNVKNEDGTNSPAVWIKGYCTILCVIKPLIDEGQTNGKLRKPYVPNPNDTHYFCSF
jgi:hypothetical protein